MPDSFWLILRIGGYLAIALACLVIAITVGLIALLASAVIGVWIDEVRKRLAADREYALMCENALRYAEQLYQHRDAVQE